MGQTVSYRNDDGYPYFDYQPTSPGSHVVPEDLAVTLLVNSRATGKSFKSIQKYGTSVNPALLEASFCTRMTRFENLRGGNVFDLGPTLLLGLRLLRAARVLAQLRKGNRPRQVHQHVGQLHGGQVVEDGPFIFG